MFFNTVHSEWIKLTTTKSFWWTSALFVFLSTGFAALLTFAAKMTTNDLGLEGGYVDTSMATTALYALGFTVLIVQAAMVFTSEYRNSTASVTFTATPHRALVPIAKALLYAVIAAIITFVTLIICFYVCKAIGGSPIAGTPAFNPWTDDSARHAMWFYPMAIAGLVFLTQGVSMLVRQTAGAVSIMLVWFMALEQLISMLPKIGTSIAKFGPMTNLVAFNNQRSLEHFVPWEYSVWVFWAWALGVFILGLIAVSRRDV